MPELKCRSRSLGLVALASTVGTLANGLRLRDRLERIDVLADVASTSDDTDGGTLTFLVAEGVTVDAATRVAVQHHRRSKDLDVIDLVPATMPVEDLLDLARLVDIAGYRTSRLAAGRSALHAIAADSQVVARAGITRTEKLDPVEMVQAAIRLKQFAPDTTDFVVVPELGARELDLDKRLAYLQVLAGGLAKSAAAMPMIQLSLLALVALRHPKLAIATLAAGAVQPYLATTGTPFTPDDLTPAFALTRPVSQMRRAWSTLSGTWRPTGELPGDPSAIESRREVYTDLIAGGLESFFESRRSTCPMCESSHIDQRISTTDLLQFKPGRFVLDECRDCGHIFQNPRLSIRGLDYYYRDFYDGLGEAETDGLFSASEDSYQGRAAMVQRVTEPKTWLDVGCGHGHFCLIAAESLPATRFDGLDMSSSVSEAEARGWITTGHRGMFPDLAPEMAGEYDVVSMHHYLEHTRDPLAELDAAHTAIAPGGHLLIELPNPQCRSGRLFGRYWLPWFQPQHQHFLSAGSLTTALEDRGFDVVDVEFEESHQPVDLSAFFWLLGQRLAPAPTKPWTAPPTTSTKLGRIAAMVFTVPLVALGFLVDRTVAPLMSKGPTGSNTYRLLARRKA